MRLTLILALFFCAFCFAQLGAIAPPGDMYVSTYDAFGNLISNTVSEELGTIYPVYGSSGEYIGSYFDDGLDGRYNGWFEEYPDSDYSGNIYYDNGTLLGQYGTPTANFDGVPLSSSAGSSEDSPLPLPNIGVTASDYLTSLVSAYRGPFGYALGVGFSLFCVFLAFRWFRRVL